SEIPDEVFDPRFGLMWMLAVNGLSDRQRLGEVSRNTLAFSLPVLFVTNLVDSLSGLISAPVSAPTMAEIRELRARGEHRS
ncbi:MAG: hypothetical protein OEV14_09680, partial [Gammaproteobacteria bacterium]|nr:hypothetical protein [Gammaproteobacteria bacterium]